jgi:protein-tyrosine phosphatase
MLEITLFRIKCGKIQQGCHAIEQRFLFEELSTMGLLDRYKKLKHKVIEKDLTVYVHCWGGRGRTGTVVGLRP